MENLLNTSPLISLVLPLFNEGSHILSSLRVFEKILKGLDIHYEICLVDDGSVDNTWQEIKTAKTEFDFIKAVRFSRNFGKEAAIRAGLEMARGEAAIVMDGDLQHPPSLLPEMISQWRYNDVQIVEAVKLYRGREAFGSKMRAELFYFLFGQLAGYNLKQASDFKLLDRKAVDALLSLDEFNPFFRGLSSWIGFKRTQVYFEVQPRIDGISSWSLFTLSKLALTAVTAFSSAPLHLITFIGILFGIFSIILGTHTAYMKLLGETIPGYTTVVFLLLIVGGCIMIGMGIIGEYVARIYDEVKKRPKFIISESL